MFYLSWQAFPTGQVLQDDLLAVKFVSAKVIKLPIIKVAVRIFVIRLVFPLLIVLSLFYT